MNQYPNGVPLLPPSYMGVVALTACRHDLLKDSASAAWKWGVTPDVAHMIRQMTPNQIGSLSNHITASVPIIRLYRGDAPEYWSRLIGAVQHADQTAIDLLLASSLMTAPHDVTRTPSPVVEAQSRLSLATA